MWQFWLIMAGLCIIIESITVGFFVFWFAIGALISLVVSLFIDNFLIQAIVFVIASSLLILFTKPLVKKFLNSPNTKPTNVYSIIGKEGIVLEDIDSINSTGKVKVEGELWSAIADENLEKDSKIKVIGIDGVKLKVEKLKVSSGVKI